MISVGPYTLYDAFASGGMATVHHGKAGDTIVAIKRLHPHLRGEEGFAVMLLDEANLARKIDHPNVVPVLDVVSTDAELLLVMEYVHGLSLSELSKRRQVPLAIASTIIVGVLRGLQAAHDAVPGLVHRDVSPQNVLVGVDGVARLTDFGVAKAAGRLRSTRDGGIKGKIAYMPPEQVAGEPLDSRADVYAAGVVFWELLTGAPLFDAENDVALFGKVMRGATQRLSEVWPNASPALDTAMSRALARDPRRRFASAGAFADAIESACGAPDEVAVASWVRTNGGDVIAQREARIARLDEEEELRNEATVAKRRAEILGAPPSRRTSSSRLLVALGAAAVVFGAGSLVYGWARKPPPARPEPDPTAIEDVTAPLPAASSPTLTPTASPTPTLAPTPTLTPTPSSSTRPRPKPHTASPAKPSCDPPTYIDSRGITMFKPGCAK